MFRVNECQEMRNFCSRRQRKRIQDEEKKTFRNVKLMDITGGSVFARLNHIDRYKTRETQIERCLKSYFKCDIITLTEKRGNHY